LPKNYKAKLYLNKEKLHKALLYEKVAKPFYFWQTVSKGQTWQIWHLKSPNGNPASR